ncbi:hypothetical protein GUJ93_ZPchr0003g17117 [Zizania palustris]|uniref:Uncharacterized protein n=1 Tax=Zizania palustris TaxID=103762 RepID=A0A8J5S6A9_ZIZPA|nr:hypothetical protein GUJ93_ZPchr0003g17117 [Zizania palustris]
MGGSAGQGRGIVAEAIRSKKLATLFKQPLYLSVLHTIQELVATGSAKDLLGKEDGTETTPLGGQGMQP